MEKKIVYLKLFQIVLTLTIIWQLFSLRQFCGTFADPKAFRCVDCERITLIGQDSKTGEFGLFSALYSQYFMNRTKGQQSKEQERQTFDEIIALLPPAGHECIPITIRPFDWLFDWTGMLNRNAFKTRTLFLFSDLFFYAFWSLVPLCIVIMEMLRSVEEYYAVVYWYAFFSVFCWCCTGMESFKLLLNWTDLWTCVNFRADHTIVPLISLVLSLVLVCSSIFEIVLHEFLLNDVVDPECANMMIIDQQQKKKNESAIE